MELKKRLDWCSRSLGRLQGLRRLDWPYWFMLRRAHAHTRTHTHTHTHTLTHPVPLENTPCYLCWALNAALSSHLPLTASSLSSTDCDFEAALRHRSTGRASEQLLSPRSPSTVVSFCFSWPSMCDEGAYWPADVHALLSGSVAGQVTVERLRPGLLDDTRRHLPPIPCVSLGVWGHFGSWRWRESASRLCFWRGA